MHLNSARIVTKDGNMQNVFDARARMEQNEHLLMQRQLSTETGEDMLAKDGRVFACKGQIDWRRGHGSKVR